VGCAPDIKGGRSPFALPSHLRGGGGGGRGGSIFGGLIRQVLLLHNRMEGLMGYLVASWVGTSEGFGGGVTVDTFMANRHTTIPATNHILTSASEKPSNRAAQSDFIYAGRSQVRQCNIAPSGTVFSSRGGGGAVCV